MRSIVTEYDSICFFCGKPAVEEHHLLFGNGTRQLAEEDGIKVPTCKDCHTIGVKMCRVHDNPMAERLSKMLGQAIWEKEYGTRDQFRARYGKSYL